MARVGDSRLFYAMTIEKTKDYYQILGCDYGCDEDRIKAAYRIKVKELHPDHGGDEERFLQAKEAFDTLKDTGKRAEYDSLIGLRELNGSVYRTTKPHHVVEGTKDIYDDIKEVLKRGDSNHISGTVYMEADEREVFRNVDGAVILAPILTTICRVCKGMGGWFGKCGGCGGGGKVENEYLIPFKPKDKLTAGEIYDFKYRNLNVRLMITDGES
ncbi:MAG: DnaJ domain-containing protein [candidate division Zixibacteria bacterium]|nr:DnaJ domain-containing protein [candidate division Zixibacteria bacterium]